MEASDERRLEEFRSDLDADEVEEALARHARALAEQFYVLAVPAFLNMRQLTEVIQGRRYVAPDACPLGGWMLMRDLADPSTTTVSPNVDTLYGATYVLLDRQGPVVCTIPEITDRYASVAFMDAYFEHFAIVSPRTHGVSGGDFLIVPRGWSGEVPSSIAAAFEAPTPSVCLVQRIYTRGRGEVERVHALQDGIVLSPLDGWLRGEQAFPPVEVSEFEVQGMRDTADPLEFFRLMNAYTGMNPPPGADAGLIETFRAVGLGPSATLPNAEVRRAAIVAGARDAQTAIDAAITDMPSRGGWRLPVPSSGRPGGDLLARAAVQMTQMELLPVEEALYFFGYGDGAGNPLRGEHAYELRFEPGSLPPTDDLGFWSVTMYDERSLLVDNEIDRYVLRPDTQGLTFDDDGSMTIRVQHARPDDAPLGNWLPAPSGHFNLALRVYLPQEPVVDGSWRPPAIIRRQPSPDHLNLRPT